jgi:hypothetical protein
VRVPARPFAGPVIERAQGPAGERLRSYLAAQLEKNAAAVRGK